MERFIERYKDSIVGTISGFDRILFRGQILSICHIGGLERFLSSQRILNKEFRRFAEMFTERIKHHAEEVAQENGRPYFYLASPSIRKDDFVRKVMANSPVDQGLVCVLSCVEPCHSFGLHSDRRTKLLLLKWEERKCQHYYFYYVDREFRALSFSTDEVRISLYLDEDYTRH